MILFKILKKLRVWWYLHISTLNVKGKGKYTQPVRFIGRGNAILGDGNVFGVVNSAFYDGTSYIEARHEDSDIYIGQNNHFNNNLTIVAEHGKIRIGDDCLVGTNVSIINSDFHHVSIAKRHGANARSKDVEIGNNVFIGSNVSICKGVHIGDNAVIANGAVVFDDVKANTIVRGNPATYYKEIYE